MGNSLTYIFEKREQLKVLREFQNLLKERGILVVDERNYQNVLDHRQEYLSGQKLLTGRYMYTGGDKVDARWVEIKDDAVTAQLTHNGTGLRGYFRGYPFKRGELLGLFREAGFSEIKKFSDYQPGDNPDADFYQYVCVK